MVHGLKAALDRFLVLTMSLLADGYFEMAN